MSGKLGFFHQVSGGFKLRKIRASDSFGIMRTHTKYYPAEHHSQSAIEAAIQLHPLCHNQSIKNILIETFDVAVEIIGSEKEKWQPQTRETADHSLPYLTVAALLDGDITLEQYREKRYLDKEVRALLKKVSVKRHPGMTHRYPKWMPTRVTVTFLNGEKDFICYRTAERLRRSADELGGNPSQIFVHGEKENDDFATEKPL